MGLRAHALCCCFFITMVAAGRHKGSGPTVPLTMLDARTYPNARCLDGSPFGLYVKTAAANASAEARKSWLVVLNGGGLCTHKTDCQQRATTDLGSSTKFTSVFELNSISFLSDDKRNPYREWNLAFVPYCSGDMHAGQRTVANEATYGLYFAGFHNVMATVAYLSKMHGLATRGNTLIWGGGSAGGVGVFTSLDAVADTLRDAGVRVVGAPIGGFPPDLSWSTIRGAEPPEEDLRTMAFQRNNALFDAFLPKRCVAALGEASSYKCGVPHLAYPYLATPTFVIQSLTDVVVLCDFEGMPCKPIAKALLNPEVWWNLDQYAHNATMMLDQTVFNNPRDGLFAASCLIHTGFNLDGPIINGTSAPVALYQWLTQALGPGGGVAYHHIDRCRGGRFYPPCGKRCPLKP